MILEIDDKKQDLMFALMHKVSTHPKDLTASEKKRLRELGLEVK
jgi:hypothetical protein